MPTVKLIPTEISQISPTYSSVENTENMFHDVSNTTYGTFTHTKNSTAVAYRPKLLLKGFDFSAIPTGATVTSYTVKVKGSSSGCKDTNMTHPAISRDSGITSIARADSLFPSEPTVIEFDTSEITWEQFIKPSYGSIKTGIVITLQRNASAVPAVANIYGAEINVTYSINYVKDGGEWKEATKVYEKVSGEWVESNFTTAFGGNKHFKKG